MSQNNKIKVSKKYVLSYPTRKALTIPSLQKFKKLEEEEINSMREQIPQRKHEGHAIAIEENSIGVINTSEGDLNQLDFARVIPFYNSAWTTNNKAQGNQLRRIEALESYVLTLANQINVLNDNSLQIKATQEGIVNSLEEIEKQKETEIPIINEAIADHDSKIEYIINNIESIKTNHEQKIRTNLEEMKDSLIIWETNQKREREENEKKIQDMRKLISESETKRKVDAMNIEKLLKENDNMKAQIDENEST